MKKLIFIPLVFALTSSAMGQVIPGKVIYASQWMRSPIYFIGNTVTDTAAGRGWVRNYHALHPSIYTAGFGLGLNGTQFYNSRYWKGQDSLSASLNGLVLSTAGKLTAITNNSTSWNTAYGWGNHAGLYMNKADSLFLNTIPKNSISANGLRKDGFHRLTIDSANATYGGVVTPFHYNKWNLKQNTLYANTGLYKDGDTIKFDGDIYGAAACLVSSNASRSAAIYMDYDGSKGIFGGEYDPPVGYGRAMLYATGKTDDNILGVNIDTTGLYLLRTGTLPSASIWTDDYFITKGFADTSYNHTLTPNEVHDSVTIGTANGLSRTGKQVLSLATSSTSTTGALTSTDWNTFNGKQSAITPQNVSAGSSKITLGGTYTGASLQAFSVDVNQANIDHNSLLNYNSYRHFKKTDVDSLSSSIPYSNAFDKFVVTDTSTGKLYRAKLTFGSGLTKTTSTVTNDLITGKAGGQTVIGGTGVSDHLIYKSTTGAGTTDGTAHEFVGGTNGGTSLVTVLNNGSVGIGTSTPGANYNNVYSPPVLDVTGNVAGFVGIATKNANSLWGTFWEQTNNGTKSLILGTYGSARTGTLYGVNKANNSFIYTYPANALTIGTFGAANLTLGTNSTANITVKNGGNVGFGITTPANIIHLDGGSATAAYMQGTCGSTTGQLSTDGWRLGHDASGNLELNNQEILPMSLKTRGNDRLHILANGNIGIDTTTPAYKLDVNGSVNLMAGNTYKIGGVDISLHDSLLINTTPKGSTSANGLRKDGNQRLVLDSANASYGGAMTKFQYNKIQTAYSGAIKYGVDAESTDDYVVSIDGITSYFNGLTLVFKAHTANTTSCTLNVNSLGAASVVTSRSGYPSIVADDYVMVIYLGNQFWIINDFFPLE